MSARVSQIHPYANEHLLVIRVSRPGKPARSQRLGWSVSGEHRVSSKVVKTKDVGHQTLRTALS